MSNKSRMNVMLSVLLVFQGSLLMAQNIGIGTSTPQSRLHVIDSVGNVKIVFQAVGPSVSTAKDVTLEMIQEAGTDDWLRLRKYYFTSIDYVDGVAMANSGALFAGYETGFLQLGALNTTGKINFFSGGKRNMILSDNGNLGIGTATPGSKLTVAGADNVNPIGLFSQTGTAAAIKVDGRTELNGFTRLGNVSESAPAIKMKEITMNSPAFDGGQISTAHGLTASKIISATAILEYTPGGYTTASFRPTAGYEFGLSFDGFAVYLTNMPGNSFNILNKPVKIVFTYKE